MRMEEARGYLMQALGGSDWNQYGNLLAAVGWRKAASEGKRSHQVVGDGRQFLSEPEKNMVLELIWSFIIQGILRPGLNDNNPTWPFLSLTEYGEKCIRENRVLPHDPDGFLRDFSSQVPGADQTVREYLTEALQCYLRGLNRAAAVMLGGASEKAVLLLIEAAIASVADSNERARIEKEFEKRISIYRKFERLQEFLGTQKSIPRELSDNLESLLRGVFDLIRNSRNDAGHPASGVLIDREIVYTHLCLFTPYYKRISALTNWFATPHP